MKTVANKSGDKNNRLKIVFIQVGGLIMIAGVMLSFGSVLIPHPDFKTVLRIASGIIGVLGGGIYLVDFLAPAGDRKDS
ncbi:hypothetical protein [Brucella pituitosa]|uniref:hypothetical protein n=1 Tax=Brucella pituitosa TaxID=571256 RepID=UPI0009A1443D|nr:hypothetical protein [Brucella pituitosa]